MSVPPVVTLAIYYAAVPLAVVGAALVARHLPVSVQEPVARALTWRWMPVLVTVLCALVSAALWGALDEPPMVHDEAAYLLQARLFARGMWSAPSPALPEFFEQLHVFVTPVFASKYPPGHSLLLVPGVWLGLPGIVPALEFGIAGGLLFALARRVANVWIAALSVVIWITIPGAPGYWIRFQLSYLSELTTTVLVLASWWALLRWIVDRETVWLVLLAACVGWGALTRPFTMLAYTAPMAVVVAVSLVRRHGDWRRLVVPATVCLLLLSVIPLWSYETLGDWKTTPLTRYTEVYMPWDAPGFGLLPGTPRRHLPGDLESVLDHFKPIHREHTLAKLPRILAMRVRAIASDHWNGIRLGLLPFALIGCFSLTSFGAFPLVSALLAVVVYLVYAHGPDWTVYYLETYPVISFVTAVGVWRVLAALSECRNVRSAGRRGDGALPAASLAALLLLGASGPPGISILRQLRSESMASRTYERRFRDEVVAARPGPAVLFVRYGGRHNRHRSLVRNWPPLESDPVWVVHDRGCENLRLMAAVPSRAAYLFDEDEDRIRRLDVSWSAGCAAAMASELTAGISADGQSRDAGH